MLTTTQIVELIEDCLAEHETRSGTSRSTRKALMIAAEKIVALIQPQFEMATAAAALENEVTATLMDMLAATILTILMREEGGGRANVRYSPFDMAEMSKHFDYTVDHDGMIRNVRISLKDGMKDSFFGDEPASGPSVMTDNEESTEGAKPQAKVAYHARPVWAIRANDELWTMRGRTEAERLLPHFYKADPLARIENRFCLHHKCPTSGCSEVASTC